MQPKKESVSGFFSLKVKRRQEGKEGRTYRSISLSARLLIRSTVGIVRRLLSLESSLLGVHRSLKKGKKRRERRGECCRRKPTSPVTIQGRKEER